MYFPGVVAKIWTVRPWVLKHAAPLEQPLVYNEDFKYIGGTYSVPSISTTIFSRGISDDYLQSNPRAGNYMSGRLIHWDFMLKNSADWALDIIETYKKEWRSTLKTLPDICLSRNTNPRAMSLLNIKDANHVSLSMNPAAISLLKKYPQYIVKQVLASNSSPEAKEICDSSYINYKTNDLASNPSEWAIDVMKEMYKITPKNIHRLFNNSHPWAVNLIKKYKGLNSLCPADIDRLTNNTNPEIMEWLSRAGVNIKLPSSIWANPAIFELTEPVGLFEALI